MRRYGEVGRFTEEGVTYLFGTEKWDNPLRECDDVYLPFIYFCRTVKSGKNAHCNKKDKWTIAHSLEGKTFNQSVIKKLLHLFESYIAEKNVEYLCHGVYSEYMAEHDKRLKMYSTLLDRHGYDLIKKDDSEWDRNGWIYFYKRRN